HLRADPGSVPPRHLPARRHRRHLPAGRPVRVATAAGELRGAGPDGAGHRSAAGGGLRAHRGRGGHRRGDRVRDRLDHAVPPRRAGLRGERGRDRRSRLLRGCLAGHAAAAGDARAPGQALPRRRTDAAGRRRAAAGGAGRRRKLGADRRRTLAGTLRSRPAGRDARARHRTARLAASRHALAGEQRRAPMIGFGGVVVIVVVLLLFLSIKVLPEYQRGVVLTLGRYTGIKGPGLVILVPIVQRMTRVDLRVTVMDVPPQDVISRDNVSVRVNAVVYFRVVEPDKSVLQVENFLQATSQLSQTRLRSVLGQHELDEILSQRDSINHSLQQILDEATDPWGIKVTNVEIKDVDLNETMVRAIARQAEAERERRAKVIHAEGELQAAEKLRDAAATLSQQPQALQLRYLQTLADMSSSGKASTIVFPLPLDLIKPLLDALPKA